MEITKEQTGRPQSAATKKKIAKAVTGKKNPAYKDGRRSYRRIAGAKKGEHIDTVMEIQKTMLLQI